MSYGVFGRRRGPGWLVALALLTTSSGGCTDAEAVPVAARPADPVLDCLKLPNPSTDPLATADGVVEVGDPLVLAPPTGLDLTGATWSPDGRHLAFVAPTEDVVAFPAAASGAAGEREVERPVGASRNEIWLYSLDAPEPDAWRLVAEHGAKPRFSADGRTLRFLGAEGLESFDLATGETVDGPRLPASAEGRLVSVPLAAGGVYGPARAGAPAAALGGGGRALPSLELGASDRVLPSPDDRRLLVDERRGREPRLVLYEGSGRSTVVARNCPYSGTQAGWSADGSTLAFPAPGPGAALYRVDAETGRREQVLAGAGRLAGVTLSPRGRFVAFAHDDGEAGWRVGVARTTGGDGVQWLGPGLLPAFSPAGGHLLWAELGTDGTRSWRLAPVAGVESAGGAS